MPDDDNTAGDAAAFTDAGELARYIADCAGSGRRLILRGGGSKEFYGNAAAGEIVSLSGICGICDYVASELYISARAATPLAEVNAALRERKQMLPFDPPQFGGGGTFGGAVAAGLSGPGKPRYGGVRDAVLGVQIINGKGELLNFGGKVMKNVAGYDVSRLMAGALGTLGVITQATVKVIPAAVEECTLVQAQPPQQAVETVRQFINEGMPLAASFYQDGQLYLRLAGGSVQWAARRIGGDAYTDDAIWQRLRDHTLAFFCQKELPLWRISVPPTLEAAEAYGDDVRGGDAVFEWNGALYWRAGGSGDEVHEQARRLGGYACLFRRAVGDTNTPYLLPLEKVKLHLHRQLKEAFDPAGILNIGRMY